jgi:hypothetical protein
MKDVTILIKFKAFQHLQTRITELHNFKTHSPTFNNSGIANEDSQYQIHDLGPDQNGQSMTVTK